MRVFPSFANFKLIDATNYYKYKYKQVPNKSSRAGDASLEYPINFLDKNIR